MNRDIDSIKAFIKAAKIDCIKLTNELHNLTPIARKELIQLLTAVRINAEAWGQTNPLPNIRIFRGDNEQTQDHNPSGNKSHSNIRK